MWSSMKNSNKSKKVIKDLAKEFDKDFNSIIPFKLLPTGELLYKNYLVKQTKNNYWGVFDIEYGNLVHEFFLKTCALLATKEYNDLKFDRYIYLKNLDRRYQAHYSDIIVYKHHIKNITDEDHFDILKNKLNESELRAKTYQKQISNLFKVTFCINTI